MQESKNAKCGKYCYVERILCRVKFGIKKNISFLICRICRHSEASAEESHGLNARFSNPCDISPRKKYGAISCTIVIVKTADISKRYNLLQKAEIMCLSCF